MVGVVVMDVGVQHDAGVRDGDLSTGPSREGEILGERRRQNTPNTVRVELQRSTDLLNKLTGLWAARTVAAGKHTHKHQGPHQTMSRQEEQNHTETQDDGSQTNTNQSGQTMEVTKYQQE